MVYVPTFQQERRLLATGILWIAGVDEVGCGAWAGPVYAAAVILPITSRLRLIRDSKMLSINQRQKLSEEIKHKATGWAIGIATHEEVDRLNIRCASALAMRRAVETLQPSPQHILSDAFRIPGLTMACTPIIRGDRYVKSIAAASIIAKVERDAWMTKMDQQFSGYGFANHKGYGTKEHQHALKQHGPCSIHRLSYAPIKKFLIV